MCRDDDDDDGTVYIFLVQLMFMYLGCLVDKIFEL